MTQHTRQQQTRRRPTAALTAGLGVALLAAGLVAAPPASAVVPGHNGRVAYTLRTVGFTDPDIWTVAADGTGRRRLTTDGRSSHPKWGPGGSRIAFQRSTRRGVDVFTMKADGTDVRQVTFNGVSSEPVWTADALALVVTRVVAGHHELVRVALRTGSQVRLTHRGPAGCDSDQADLLGTQLVYHQRCAALEQIRWQDLTNGFDLPLITVDPTDGSRVHDPELTADAGHVQFMSCLPAVICVASENVAVITTQGTGLQLLTDSGGIEGDPHYLPSAPSPDGTTLALVFTEPDGNGGSVSVITAGVPPATLLYGGAQPATEPDWQSLR